METVSLIWTHKSTLWKKNIATDLAEVGQRAVTLRNSDVNVSLTLSNCPSINKDPFAKRVAKFIWDKEERNLSSCFSGKAQQNNDHS